MNVLVRFALWDVVVVVVVCECECVYAHTHTHTHTHTRTHTIHSVYGLQRRAFLLREYTSGGILSLPMTSGGAIIFCINDEQQQPAMREMDFVLRRRAADYGQQHRRQGERERAREREREREKSSHKQLKRRGDRGPERRKSRFVVYWRGGSDNLCGYHRITRDELSSKFRQFSSSPFSTYVIVLLTWPHRQSWLYRTTTQHLSRSL